MPHTPDIETTTVLFLCPHSAGKSVFAAVYFRAAAARLGVPATALVAGTEPDDEVMPNVAAALDEQGFRIVDVPHLVTPADTARADIVISIGCDHGEVPADEITEWDVPLISERFDESMNAIHTRAERLAADLAAGGREATHRR